MAKAKNGAAAKAAQVGAGAVKSKGASATAKAAARDTPIIDNGKTSVATDADLALAAGLAPSAQVADHRPVSFATVSLLSAPAVMNLLKNNSAALEDVKGCSDIPGALAAIQEGLELSQAYPRLAVTFARVRQAAVENNQVLEAFAKSLATAATTFAETSALGKVLSPLRARRAQVRGARKRTVTHNKNKAAKTAGAASNGAATPAKPATSAG